MTGRLRRAPTDDIFYKPAKTDPEIVTMSRHHCDNGAAFEGFVYLISWGEENPVKVGWSTQPFKRLKEIQTSHPHELKILGVFPGARPLEKEAHRAMGNTLRRSGEWFEWTAAKYLVRAADPAEMTVRTD